MKYTILFSQGQDVGWNGLSAIADEFDFDHHQPGENDTFIEVYIAEVDEEKVALFERVLDEHPNLISYERAEQH